MFLSKGNRKCKNMWIFNLPAVKACPNHTDCAATCYAMKAQRMYKTAREAREANFKAARTVVGRRKLKEFIIDKIIHGPYSVVRIHESGDFFCQGYVDMWAEIATLLPDIKFYAYTKAMGCVNMAGLTSLANVNIINSYIHNLYLNYGNKKYITWLMNLVPQATLCPATAKQVGHKCNVDCKICQDGEQNVVFLQH